MYRQPNRQKFKCVEDLPHTKDQVLCSDRVPRTPPQPKRLASSMRTSLIPELDSSRATKPKATWFLVTNNLSRDQINFSQNDNRMVLCRCLA